MRDSSPDLVYSPNVEVTVLKQERLVELYRELRDVHVLSVYIDAGQTDPADRRAWSTALERGLADERRRLENDDPDDLDGFDRARHWIADALSEEEAFLHGRGWVGFATADGLKYGESLAVPMPDLVRWEGGIRAAPYVRALKQNRVVVAAVADRRHARIFTYQDGTLTECADLIADRDFGDLSESASSPRATGHSGARGEPGSDLAQRLKDSSAARMRSEILQTVHDLAGRDGLVVFGGTGEMVSAMAREANGLSDRFVERASMHLGMSEAEVKGSVEEAASELTKALQSRLLTEVLDAARSGGRGSLGIQATREALREHRVDTLLITRRFRTDHADLADHFVGTAFEQGAGVEELSDAAADGLAEDGEGVAARLRYVT